MSLIPAFEIGVWNAWIFMLYSLLPVPLVMLINKSTAETGDSTSVYNKTEKKILYSYHIVVFLLLIYSIFLPLQLGTTWFYIGLPICLLGLITYTMVMVSFATTSLDVEPIGLPPENRSTWNARLL